MLLIITFRTDPKNNSRFYYIFFLRSFRWLGCKTAVSPLLLHWRYCSLALSHRDGLVQDCSISIVIAMEILQPCTKPSILPSAPLFTLPVAGASLAHSRAACSSHAWVHWSVTTPAFVTLQPQADLNYVRHLPLTTTPLTRKPFHQSLISS